MLRLSAPHVSQSPHHITSYQSHLTCLVGTHLLSTSVIN